MYGVRDDTRCQWVSACWPLNVQYVGGEGVWLGLMLVSRGARCEVVCLLRGVGLRDGLVVPVAGVVVASMV